MKNIKIKSYCKINLSLRVIKKLQSGYHSIVSFITFCDLHDIISISKTTSLKDKISFSGQFKKNINKKSNTISKTLDLLRKIKFIEKQAYKINIKKNIPHGSGLGGGSSNAAALLNFFVSKMKIKASNSLLEKVSKKIGSDVSICLVKKNSLLKNNNKVLRFKKKFNLNILLVYPNLICSTKKIYQKNKTRSLSKPQKFHNMKNRNQLIKILKNEKNDLERTVFKIYPKIKMLINYIKSQKGCHFSRITGSGSACIGIFSKMEHAIYVKKLIKIKYPKYWCVVSKTI